MSVAFSQTLRSLNRDRLHQRAAAVFAVVVSGMLLLWGLWFFLAPVSVRVVSVGRLEASTTARPVPVLVSGRVATIAVTLGQPVQEGDLLVALDAEEARLARDEAASRCAGLRAQEAALAAELAAAEAAATATAEAGTAAAAAARADAAAAAAAAELAEADAARAASLAAGGYTAAADGEQKQAESAQRLAEANAASQRARRDQRAARRDALAGEAGVASLRRELAALTAAAAVCTAQHKQAELAVQRHEIRAPSDGVIGRLAVNTPGAAVSAGDEIAAVVPEGDVRAVARFPVADAAGRIQPGQAARVRLDGFPWGQYGAVTGAVAAVAAEPGPDGLLRVEVTVDRDNPRVPLLHGLPGSVEVDVESLTPAALALRAAGRRVARPAR